MKTRSRIGLVSLIAGTVGCGGALEVAEESRDTAPVLGHLQSRDRKLTIYVAPGGPRFAVRTAEGRLVGRDLSLGDLQARHPDLFRAYQTSVAATALDASLTVRAAR